MATVDLLPALRRIERRFGREVNLTRYSEKEFRNKIRDGDHFLKSVTKDKFVLLRGLWMIWKKLLAEHKVHTHSTSKGA